MAKPAQKKLKKGAGGRSGKPSKDLAPAAQKKKSWKGEARVKRAERKGKKAPGLRLSKSAQKELGITNREDSGSDEEEDVEEKDLDSIYEYEQPLAEEETQKNRRYDAVESYEFELPPDFKDEDISSDDDDGEEDGQGAMDDGHLDVQGDVGSVKISVQDLVDPLQGQPGYSKIRKQLDRLEKNSMTVDVPLRKSEKEKSERMAAYKKSKKIINQWEPLVKKNREAPTLYFDAEVDLQYSTVGAIASEFKPRTEFEKKMNSLVHAPVVSEAYMNDGAKLLELNVASVEDIRDRQNRLAKMRSLLFRHELKAKHIKKIKSKAYHRISKKEGKKAALLAIDMDSESVKERARKQEFKRAEERLTLKHKNSSKWAKRIIERGLNHQDEGTRAAIAEQLNQHTLLTRKMNSMRDSSSSDESSDEDEEELPPEDNSGGISMILSKAKEKTLKVMEEENMPKSGLFSLPFMERALRKNKEAADDEARLAIEEYESLMGQSESGNEVKHARANKTGGRKVFLASTNCQPEKSSSGMELKHIRNNSDGENDFDASELDDVGHEANDVFKEAQFSPAAVVSNGVELQQGTSFKGFGDAFKESSPKTSYDVAIFAPDLSRKLKAGSKGEGKKSEAIRKAPSEDLKFINVDENSASDSDEEVVEGITSSRTDPEYELPSQADLIHRAFASDDVEARFEKDKLEALKDENPEPEKPSLIPGWGQWTSIQQKKGVPAWQREEYENKMRNRDKTLKERKDAQLKHAIISEAIDKKADKLYSKAVPFPYSSKEAFESNMRMPIGPEYNPAISVGALNRPSVVKTAGVIIQPIRLEEVDPHEKADEPRRILQKATGTRGPKTKKTKPSGGATKKKAPLRPKPKGAASPKMKRARQ